MKRGVLKFTACCLAAGMTLGGTGTVAFASKDTELAGIHTYAEDSQEETAAEQTDNAGSTDSSADTEAAAETESTEAAAAENTETETAETAAAENTETETAETAAADNTEAETAETEAAVDTSLNGTQAFAQCDEYINVRSGADTNSEVVGKVYNNGSVTILSQTGDWYEVQSGNVTGYVKAEYFATGAEAEAIAEEVGYNVATVHPEALMIRSEPSEDSEAIGMAESSDQLEVVAYEGDWMKVALDADTYGYVNAYYVSYDTYYSTAETLEEEQARLDQQWLDYLAEQEAEQQAAEEAYLAAIAEQEAQVAAAEQAAADAAAQAAAEQQAAADQAAADQAAAQQQAEYEAQVTADAQAQADAAYQEYLDAQAAADAATQQADEQAVADTAAQAQAEYQEYLDAQAAADAQAQAEADAAAQAQAAAEQAARAGERQAGSSRASRSRAGGGRTGGSGAGSGRTGGSGTGSGRAGSDRAGSIRGYVLHGYFSQLFSGTGDCQLRAAVRGKSLCMGRNQPDQRSGLFRIYTVCIREFRNRNSSYSRIAVRQRNTCQPGQPSGRRPDLLRRRRNQPCSAVHRRRPGGTRQQLHYRNYCFKLQLQNTGFCKQILVRGKK